MAGVDVDVYYDGNPLRIADRFVVKKSSVYKSHVKETCFLLL